MTEEEPEVHNTLLKYDRRLKRWKQQIKDINDDLDFIKTERITAIRERLSQIYDEMDSA